MSNKPVRLYTFSDTSRLVLDQLHKDARDFVDSVMSEAKDKKIYLEDKVRTTCSGQLISGRCYTGWGMKKGTPSWFSAENGGSAAFNKPILLNHDMDGPIFGRVVNAEFVQLKTGLEWEDDWRNPDTGLKLGSGYIVTTGHIMDKDAIEKVMDGRWNTVSSRQAAHQAWCSVCGEDFLTDNHEHVIGRTYEVDDSEVLCYAVTGELTYKERSYVADPRQQNATTMSFTLKDSDNFVMVSEELDVKEPILGLALLADNAGRVDLLSSDALPSTTVLTGKVKSMAKTKKGTPKSVQLKGLDIKSLEISEASTDSTAPDLEEKPEENKNSTDTASVDTEKPLEPIKDFAFAHLSKIWKDDLNLKDDFQDMEFAYGITEKSSNHAHGFSLYIDYKKKVVSGYTTLVGQGKPDSAHNHTIWATFKETADIAGDTREADFGPTHKHTFKTIMADGASTCGTLIASSEDINSAVADLESRIEKQILDASDAEKLKQESIIWDAAYVKAASRLLGRIANRDTLARIIGQMNDAGVFGKEEESEDGMEKATLEKLVAKLTHDNEDLTTRLTEVTALADQREKDRKELLDQVTSLTEKTLRAKARTVVGFRNVAQDKSGLTAEEMDSAVNSLLEELKTEEALDAEIAKGIPAKPEKSIKDAASKPKIPVVSEEDPSAMDSDSNGSLNKKSLAGIDRRISQRQTG